MNSVADSDIDERTISPTKAAKRSNEVFSMISKLEPDDEVFLVECPPNVDASSLDDIQFDDRNEFEFEDAGSMYKGRFSDSPSTLNLLLAKDEKNWNIRRVSVNGVINIERKVKQLKVKPFVDEDVSVPYPSGLVQRHPLLGVNWEEVTKKASATSSHHKKRK